MFENNKEMSLDLSFFSFQLFSNVNWRKTIIFSFSISETQSYSVTYYRDFYRKSHLLSKLHFKIWLSWYKTTEFFIENHAFVITFDVSNAFAKQKNSLNANGFIWRTIKQHCHCDLTNYKPLHQKILTIDRLEIHMILLLFGSNSPGMLDNVLRWNKIH